MGSIGLKIWECEIEKTGLLGAKIAPATFTTYTTEPLLQEGMEGQYFLKMIDIRFIRYSPVPIEAI